MFKIFVAVALLLGVSVDQPVNSKLDGGVKSKAVQAEPDAGVKTFEEKQTERRTHARSLVQDMCDQTKKNTGLPVSIDKMLFSTEASTEDHDAAIVVVSAGGSPVGMFLLYKNGQWHFLNDDFR